MHVAVILMKSLLLHFARILLAFKGHHVGEGINILFPLMASIFNSKVYPFNLGFDCLCCCFVPYDAVLYFPWKKLSAALPFSPVFI